MGDASTHQLNAAAIAVLDSIPETDEELGIARLELFGANIIDCGVEVTGAATSTQVLRISGSGRS
jgi:methenyltetrahydromethanopterin cyclohydrolase